MGLVYYFSCCTQGTVLCILLSFSVLPTLSDEILKGANRAKKEKENQNIATTILLKALLMRCRDVFW
jgi:hypothetical protein